MKYDFSSLLCECYCWGKLNHKLMVYLLFLLLYILFIITVPVVTDSNSELMLDFLSFAKKWQIKMYVCVKTWFEVHSDGNQLYIFH